MERVGAVNPAQRVFGVQLRDGGGGIERDLPFLGAGVNLPAHFQHVRVRPQRPIDVVQLGVSLDVVAQLQPTLAGLYRLRQSKRDKGPVNTGWDEGLVCMS